MKPELSKTNEAVEAQLISLAQQVRRFFRILKQRWWILVVTVLLGLTAEWAYNHFNPPGATVLARMLVGGKIRIPEGGLFAEEWQNFFGTQVELMESERISRRTLDRLDRLRENQNASPIRLEVSQVRKTMIFVLQAKGKNEAYTTAYLNALMDEYLSYRKEVRALSSDDTLASLTSQFLEQEKELKRQQEGMLAFQKTNSLAILREQSSSANLTKLNSELADLKLQQALLVDSLEPAGAKEERGDSRPLLNPMDGRPKEVLAMLKFRKSEWSKILRPEHPRMQKLDQDIARTEQLIAVYKTGDKEQLSFVKESIDSKIQGVNGAIAETEAKMIDANRLLAEYSLIQQNVERTQNHYEHILRLLQNVGLDKNVDQESVVILDQATPVVFKKSLIQQALAGIIGLIIGLGIVGAIASRDDRLGSLSELRLHFPETLLGQIPVVRGRKRKDPLGLLETHDRRHVFAESCRALRSCVLFIGPAEERPRTILVTSAMPGEGKSTVAVNLARSLAFGGSKVLLVDGDLRTGQLHQLLGTKPEPGLSQLDARNGLESILWPTSVPNLSFIARGRPDLDCGELFLSQDLDRLLKESATAFDYVLFDSAPVFAAADTTSLAPKVDGVIFVVRDSLTRAELAREALNKLYQLKVRVLGMVLNGARGSAVGYQCFSRRQYHVSEPEPAARN
jgi:capsular exopolysaccharide synthesis family protein